MKRTIASYTRAVKVDGDGEDTSPFGAGPYSWLATVLMRGARGGHRPWRDALLTGAVLWLPLAILSAIQGLAIAAHPRESFLLDVATYGRYLVAAPLFVLAGSVCLPQLAMAVRQFVDAGLIADRDRARYDALIDSTLRLLTSRWTDAAILAAAYGATLMLSRVLYPADFSTWVTPGAPESHRLSLAGWWRTLVSQPLFLSLQATWLWRLLLWARFLWGVSRMDLQLVPGHPDRVGGLRFVQLTARSFLILALAWGTIAASSVGDGVIFDGEPISHYSHLILAHVLTVLLICAGPALVLWAPLLRAQWHGTIEYGRLASDIGREFEAKWTAGRRRLDEKALEATDFSATTDLFSIVANVSDMKVLFLDVSSIAVLVGATLLPFVPLIFVRLPLDEILRMALKALM
jgi:hypothetical protein